MTKSREEEYVLVPLDIINNEIMKKPPLYLKVLIHFILQAKLQKSSKSKKARLNTTISEIQESCSYYVGFRKVTPSKDKIYNVVKWLKHVNKEGKSLITTTKEKSQLVITIDNVSVYKQDQENEYKDETQAQNELIPYQEVIDYLNQMTGARYRSSVEANRKLIRARFNEGYTLENFRQVIDNQVNSWQGTEWAKYLQPKTLFSSKFDGYLNSNKLKTRPTNLNSEIPIDRQLDF